jgi:hypothetical protein
MAGWFRKQKHVESETNAAADGPDEQRGPGTYAPYVPASVRVPELQRFASFDTEIELDEPDEDIEFLTALASEVPPPVRPSPKPARPLTQNEKMIDRKPDNLQIFREFAPQVDYRTSVSQVIDVRDVEIGDLLEDLSTTAAALRRKKAA